MIEKLKKLNFRLTELANYLDISRPTLYKYIGEYENKKYKNIDKRSKNVLNFIHKKSTVSKIQVINHIINSGDEDVSKELEGLFKELSSNEYIKESIIADIHRIGIVGVLKKIENMYLVIEGDENND